MTTKTTPCPQCGYPTNTRAHQAACGSDRADEPNAAPGSDDQPSQTSGGDKPSRTTDAQAAQQMRAAWEQLSQADFDGCIGKTSEYGYVDLDLLGAGTLAIIDPDGSRFHDLMQGMDELQRARVVRELGIAFYTHGKIARVLGAYADGRIPSDDTWLDITVYAMMARLNRLGQMEKTP